MDDQEQVDNMPRLSEDDALPLSHVLAADSATLPLSANVLKGVQCGKESLYAGQRITVLYLEETTVVKFDDGRGRCFHEPVSLDACRFLLLPELEANDGKTYATVRNVMRNAELLPQRVRATTGYGLEEIEGEEDIEEGDVFDVCTTMEVRNGQECVVWCRISGGSSGDGSVNTDAYGDSSSCREPLAIPLDAACEFCANVDDRRHRLQDIVRMVKDRRAQLPLRVEVARPSSYVSTALPSRLIGRKLIISELPQRKSIIATNGADVFRISESLCDEILVSENTCQVQYDVAVATMANLAQCVDSTRIRTIGPPEPASISSQLPGNMSPHHVSISSSCRAIVSPEHFQRRVDASNRQKMVEPMRRILSRSKSAATVLMHRPFPTSSTSSSGVIDAENEYVLHEPSITSVTSGESESPTASAATSGQSEYCEVSQSDAQTDMKQGRRGPYEEVKYGYSALKPQHYETPSDDQNRRWLPQRLTTIGMPGGGFDENNYAVMEGTADTALYSEANDVMAGGNLYSVPPRSNRRVTHESVTLPRVSLSSSQKKKKGPAPQPPTVVSPETRAPPPLPPKSDSPIMPRLEPGQVAQLAAQENIYMVPNSRPSSRPGSESPPAIKTSDDSPYQKLDARKPPSPVKPSPRPSPLAARRHIINPSSNSSAPSSPSHRQENQALYANQPEGCATPPKPKPRKSVSKTNLLDAHVPVQLTDEPCDNAPHPPRSSEVLRPSSSPEDELRSTTIPVGYVEFTKHETLAAELSEVNEKLRAAEREVERLQDELERRKEQCHCMDRMQGRMIESYEYHQPRNTPIGSNEIIGRNSSI